MLELIIVCLIASMVAMFVAFEHQLRKMEGRLDALESLVTPLEKPIVMKHF